MPLVTSVFIATSLDGFISRVDGSIDWLQEMQNGGPADEDYGYNAFIETVDALVMGRNTFEQALSFGQWPYGSRKVWVLSRRPVAIPAELSGSVFCTSESPANLVAHLSQTGATHLYIDGGLTIQSFLKAGLIDHLTITTIPILLGAGKPLFGPTSHDIRLQHVATQSFPSGFVQSKYRVVKCV